LDLRVRNRRSRRPVREFLRFVFSCSFLLGSALCYLQEWDSAYCNFETLTGILTHQSRPSIKTINQDQTKYLLAGLYKQPCAPQVILLGLSDSLMLNLP
jgi:hypothetical protein